MWACIYSSKYQVTVIVTGHTYADHIYELVEGVTIRVYGPDYKGQGYYISRYIDHESGDFQEMNGVTVMNWIDIE